jgi:hypothetical protein
LADVSQNIRLLPDVTLELLLNSSGTVRATFFYRQNVDYLTGGIGGTGGYTTRRYGTSLSYNKEFNHLSEFFKGREKKKNGNKDSTSKDSTNKPSVDSASLGEK